jgi:hypothetical protein
MAPALKLWIGLAVGGLALVSTAFLPPAISPVRQLPQRLPQEVRAASLAEDAAHTSALIRRMRWMDSLPALALATARDGLAVGGDPRLVTPEQLDTIRGLLRDELSTVRRASEPPVVGYYVQLPNFAGEVNDYYVDVRTRTELFAGRVGGTPYCLLLDVRGVPLKGATLDAWRDAEGTRHSDLLHTCRLVAAYGLPGPEVRAWLARGGFRYAERSGATAGLMPDAAAPFRDILGRRGVVGGWRSLTPDRCVAGQRDACADLFLERTDAEIDPFDGTSLAQDFPLSLGATLAPPRAPALTDAARYLLSDLEREHGAEAFRRFWTSDQDVAAAFAQAFGEPVDAWTVRWVATHVGLQRSGPALPHRGWIGMVLLLLAAAFAGGVWQRRRAVA